MARSSEVSGTVGATALAARATVAAARAGALSRSLNCVQAEPDGAPVEVEYFTGAAPPVRGARRRHDDAPLAAPPVRGTAAAAAPAPRPSPARTTGLAALTATGAAPPRRDHRRSHRTRHRDGATRGLRTAAALAAGGAVRPGALRLLHGLG